MKIEALKLKRLNKIKILQILRIKDSFWKKKNKTPKDHPVIQEYISEFSCHL